VLSAHAISAYAEADILRDVAPDYRRGRAIFRPDLARFACAEDDIKREIDEAGRGVDRPCARCSASGGAGAIFYARAVRALPRGDRPTSSPPRSRGIYWQLLTQIEAARCDVFSRVMRVSRPRQALIALRTWLRP
jgi:phytoene/squalene synthetase